MSYFVKWWTDVEAIFFTALLTLSPFLMTYYLGYSRCTVHPFLMDKSVSRCLARKENNVKTCSVFWICVEVIPDLDNAIH